MYEMQRVVTSSDCDQTATQSVVSIVTMMQDCSGLWLESEPVVGDWMEREHLALIITSRQLDIYRRPAYGERLRVCTSVYQFKGPLGFRNTAIYDAQGAMVACSWCTGPFIDLAAGKMVKPPQDVRDSMTVDAKLDMEYLPRRIALPAEGFEHLGTIAVRPSDIDYYRHVNNAQYVRMACDNLPQGFGFNRLRIEYKAQAKLGCDVACSLCLQDGRAFVTLADAEAKPYADLEFSSFGDAARQTLA